MGKRLKPRGTGAVTQWGVASPSLRSLQSPRSLRLKSSKSARNAGEEPHQHRNGYHSHRNMKQATTVKDGNPNPRLRRIEGRHNTLVKELRGAFARGEPTSDGYCAIEGLRILEEAIRSSLRFRAVFFSEAGAGQAARLLSQP